MKTTLYSSLVLLISLLPLGALAQTPSAKAPIKKKTTSVNQSNTTVNKLPSTGNNTSATKLPNAGNNTPASNRSNSEKLPGQAVTSQPKPQPTPQKTYVSHQPIPAHRSGFGYEKGNNLLNIGVGLSSYYYGNPIGASFEVGVDKDISVGGQIDYNSGNYGDYYYNSSRWRYTAMYIGARGSYHFNRILNLNTQKADLYAGLGLGYRSFRWSDANYGSGYDYQSGLFLNYFIGGRYYFSNKVGAFVELGYTGLSSSRIGLAVKF